MDVRDTSRRRGWHRNVFLTIVACLAGTVSWASPPRFTFDIPAGDFSQALIEFYKQTRVEILYASAESVGKLKCQAVVGDFAIAEALAALLEGTGFTFEFENPGSVLLKRKAVGSAQVEAAAESVAAAGTVATAALEARYEFDSPPIENVVVTGTFIRGVIDIMSPLLHLERREMKSTGYATVRDALLTLPMNSGAGPSEDFAGNGGNYNRGTAPNLRGLGYGATLVLVNGRRQPLAGVEADFVDTSNIPWSAVERIEVLPDGTSALYGSDAIAGVVNIIMREDLEGAETQARFASALGDANETVVAQLFGHRWDSGKLLFSYQFSDRQPLSATDRYYTADADKTPLGGSDHRSFAGSPGNILNPFTFEPAYGIPSGQDGTNLTVDELLPGMPNRYNKFEAYDLMPERRMHSVYFSASQDLNDSLELYFQGRVGQRTSQQRQITVDYLLAVPFTNAFFIDPFGGMPFVLVSYNLRDELGDAYYQGKTHSYDTTLGLKADFGRAWRANALLSQGREALQWTEYNVADPYALAAALADDDPETAFNPFGDGADTNPATIEAIRATYSSRVTSVISTASFVLDGPVRELPTGEVKLAFGAERREETLEHRLAEVTPVDYDRGISSGFAELSVPIVGSVQDPRSIPRLELSLAGRYEQYSDFGDTFNPKVGLRWVPLEWAKFRTSWGTSFKAPKLLDLYDSSQNAAGMLPLADPLSTDPSKQSLVLARQGNNPDLTEETAETWTFGVDLLAAAAPGLALSITYYDIKYKDRILYPGPPSPFDILLQESQWSEVITRHPTQEQIDEICYSPEYRGNVLDCVNSKPAAIVDYRLRNLAVTSTQGFDLKIDYAFDTRYGSFELGFNGNYTIRFDQAFTRTAEFMDIVDTAGNPLALRYRANLEWSAHGGEAPGLRLGATVDHTGSYRDTDRLNRRAIDAFTSLDLRASYRTGHGSGWLDDVEIALNVVNAFNEAPPFVDRSFGYDISNADPLGRIVSLYTRKSW